MSALDKIIQGITETIKMNDKIVSVSEKIKELASEVRDINNRVIRIEAYIEISQATRKLGREKVIS